MGVINVSPESLLTPTASIESTVRRGLQLVAEGANILDIGGESTRPYTPPISAEEELNRVIPAIRALKQSVAVPLSIDTKKAQVAKAALAEGVSMINDVSGFTDPAMRELAKVSGAPICVMHMQGTPADMQTNPAYPRGITVEIKEWFLQQIDLLLKAGVQASQIILDPGFGFGKTVAHNLEILQNLAEFKRIGFPVLVGISRKSFIARILQKKNEDILPATLALTAIALLADVDILRVHDVLETGDVVNVVRAYKNA